MEYILTYNNIKQSVKQEERQDELVLCHEYEKGKIVWCNWRSFVMGDNLNLNLNTECDYNGCDWTKKPNLKTE